uniref:Uncharacterized protein n=1 Tax=Glossina brevipalpis TaxID=37001 RepID=A0A1A9WBF3_9MUSC
MNEGSFNEVANPDNRCQAESTPSSKYVTLKAIFKLEFPSKEPPIYNLTEFTHETSTSSSDFFIRGTNVGIFTIIVVLARCLLLPFAPDATRWAAGRPVVKSKNPLDYPPAAQQYRGLMLLVGHT